MNKQPDPEQQELRWPKLGANKNVRWKFADLPGRSGMARISRKRAGQRWKRNTGGGEKIPRVRGHVPHYQRSTSGMARRLQLATTAAEAACAVKEYGEFDHIAGSHEEGDTKSLKWCSMASSRLT